MPMTTCVKQVVADEASARSRRHTHDSQPGGAVQDISGRPRVEAPQQQDGDREKGRHAVSASDETADAGAVGSPVVGDGADPFLPGDTLGNPEDLMLYGLVQIVRGISEHTDPATRQLIRETLERETQALLVAWEEYQSRISGR